MAQTSQNVDQADSQVVIEDGLALSNTADMDFGSIVHGGAGTVLMTPSETVTCVASANLIHLGPCSAAVFAGTARPGATIRIRKPARRRFTVVGPGGATMEVRRMSFGHHQGMDRLTATNLRSIRYRMTDNAGAFSFQVGGELVVGASQPDGVYTGTFEIEVEYR